MKKILIIEDHEAVRELLAVTLDCFDCEVVVARDGRQGLRMAGTHRPSIILLDILMPGLSGLEVCKRLKDNPRTANIPVVIISGKCEEADIRAGFNCGAVYYLTKPFSPIELLEKIDQIIGLTFNDDGGTKELSLYPVMA